MLIFKALKRVFGLQTKIWQNAPEWPGETTDKVSSWSDVGDNGSCPTLLPPEKKIGLLISMESILYFSKDVIFHVQILKKVPTFWNFKWHVLAIHSKLR